MTESENARARAEAVKHEPQPASSRRTAIWTSMMRYLSGETETEHRHAASDSETPLPRQARAEHDELD